MPFFLYEKVNYSQLFIHKDAYIKNNFIECKGIWVDWALGCLDF